MEDGNWTSTKWMTTKDGQHYRSILWNGGKYYDFEFNRMDESKMLCVCVE
jgi:hypothetical protein